MKRLLNSNYSGKKSRLKKDAPRESSEEGLEKAVQILERQSRIFETTLSSITDFAYIFDRGGRFVYSNQALLDLLGITLDEIVGKNFFDLKYPNELAEKLQRQIKQVFDNEQIVKDETPFTSPAGKSGYYEYIFSPVINHDGTVEVVAGSTRDITTRKQAEERLHKSEQRLQLSIEGANIFAWEVNPQTGETKYSTNFNDVLGFEISKDSKENFFNVHADEREAVAAATERAMRGAESLDVEHRIINPETGAVIWVRAQGRMINSHTEEDAPAVFLGITQNITERKRAEEELRESEERLRLVVESASDYAIITFDRDGVVESWNSGAEKIFGYRENEIIGQSGEILFTPEDREKGVFQTEMETALRTGRAEDECFLFRKDGSRFFSSGVMRPLKDGKAKGFVKIARDMTDKIEAEKAVRDKEMLRILVGAQEEERKRIARDLHDQLGQQLTALRLKIEILKGMCAGDEALREYIDETQALARQIDADVDFLAWEMRPVALEDIGLAAALANYVREWSAQFNIPADFQANRFGKKRLAPETEAHLYRIMQEALNNVYKHARAKNVDVSLERRDDFAVLIIEDDGIGFEPDECISNKNDAKCIGLTGMRERAALIGGNLEIESAPGAGTTVFVRVPVSNFKSPAKRKKKKDG